MKMLLSLVVMAILASNAWPAVTANVFLADEQTPLLLIDPNVPNVYRPIMVGTRLTIFISSDTAGGWQGFLEIPRQDVGIGILAGRGYRDYGWLGRYEGSCLEAAGTFAGVQFHESSRGISFDLFADFDAIPGEWFVLDYYAEMLGKCDIGFYYYTKTMLDPLGVLSFTHVPSRDFDGDTIVNFVDFAFLASQWEQQAVVDPNMNGSPDLDDNGVVNIFDMALFSSYWLDRTDFNEPNTPTTDL